MTLLKKKILENIHRKRRKCWKPVFSLFFLQCFQSNQRQKSSSELISTNTLNSNKTWYTFFSSTGRRPASYCHGVSSVCSSVCPFVRPCMCVCIRKLFLQKTPPQKLLTGFLRNFTGLIDCLIAE